MASELSAELAAAMLAVMLANPPAMTLVHPLVVAPPNLEQTTSFLGTISMGMLRSFSSANGAPALDCLFAPNHIARYCKACK